MEEAIAFGVVFLIIYILMYIFMIAFSIAQYMLQSLGIYTIAKRRGIDKPWLAWIPYASVWTLGCISDQYRYVKKGQVKSKRKLLIGLSIGMLGCVILFFVLYFSSFITLFINMSNASSDSQAVSSFFGAMGGMLLSYVPMIVVGIVYSVFYYIALYDLYESCNPEHSALFLVLSILASVAMPFLIFFNRKKDLGMPPRREPVQAIPPQPGWTSPQPGPNPHA